ncbi:MAG: DUF3016 domain-containing protein [Burkholderiales bacterium]|nr:DUF3016 domain-containing protein [Burkholderiales bacterium]
MIGRLFASSSRRAAMALAAVFVCASAPVAPASGTVRVTYLHPEKFTDVGDHGYVTTDRRRDALLAQLARHLEQRAAGYLPTGGTLDVTITDIDMAGGFEWWRGPAADRVRIIRNVYPPRVRLEFKVTDATGRVVSGGQRSLTGLGLTKNFEYRDDPLRHEKKLLDDWLAREFAPQS